MIFALWILLTLIVCLIFVPPPSWHKFYPRPFNFKKKEQTTLAMSSFLREMISWLETGVSPHKIFAKLTPPTALEPYFRKVQQNIEASLSVEEALKANVEDLDQEIQDFFIQLARAWQVATHAGCSLHELLSEIAEHFDEKEDQDHHFSKAIAAPKATAKILLILPAMSLVLSTLMGLVDLNILLHSTAALASIVIGIALNIGAYLWAQRMIKQVSL